MNEQDLDRRIRLALEEACAPEAVTRLEEYWRRQRRVERRRQAARRCVAIAASAALLASVLWRPFGVGDRVDPPAMARQSAPPIETPPVELPQPRPPLESRSVGREPTAYERLMFTAHVRREEAAETSRLASGLDAAIDQLAANPDLSIEELTAASLFESSDAELILLGRLPQASSIEAGVIIRLLAQHGTRRSTPSLLRAAHEKSLRTPAIAAIEQLAGSAGLAAATQQSNDRTVRRALVERLLSVGSDPALRSYLSLVSNPALRADALAVLDVMEAPPTGGLLTLLKDDGKEVRLSAAMALGYMNGPQVTKGLIAIVSDDPAAPPEAWLALLACRDESAERFLAGASQHPRLLGQVNNARMMWERMIQ